jgi:serine/threonine protein phosphatase PrpC
VSYLTSSQNVQFARTPHPKETVCGDDGAAWDDGQYTWLAVSDGLGHGTGAAAASKAALDWITNRHVDDIEATIRACDRAIRHARGISLILLKIDRENQTAKYLSIEAILGWKIQRNGARRLVGNAGVVGNGVSKFQIFDVSLSGAGFLVLASDGLSNTSDLSQLYNSTSGKNQTTSEALLDQWNTGTDDASVLLYRFTS